MNPARRLFLSSVASAAAFLAPLRQAVASSTQKQPLRPVDLPGKLEEYSTPLKWDQLVDLFRGRVATYDEVNHATRVIHECATGQPKPTIQASMRQNMIWTRVGDDTSKHRVEATEVLLVIELNHTKRKGVEEYRHGLYVFEIKDGISEFKAGMFLYDLGIHYDLNSVDTQIVNGMMRAMQDRPFGYSGEPEASKSRLFDAQLPSPVSS